MKHPQEPTMPITALPALTHRRAAVAAARVAVEVAQLFRSHYPHADVTVWDTADDWYGDGQTTAITADEDWTLDTWTSLELIRLTDANPNVWIDRYDSGVVLVGPDA